MKRIMNGKLYDTSTATRNCALACPFLPSDPAYHATGLYRSPAGQFFVAGSGGPRSMWSKQIERNAWENGSGILLISESEARDYAEDAELSVEDYERWFGVCEVG